MRGGCMDMDDPDKGHPVTTQPTKHLEALVRVKRMIMKWKDIREGEDLCNQLGG